MISKIIEDCVYSAKQNNIKIITNAWGVHPINNIWASPQKICCPLGSVLLKYNKLPPTEDFWKGSQPDRDLRDVRLNPSYSIMKIFNVDFNWVKSFWYGISSLKIGYSFNQEAEKLGREWGQKLNIIYIS